MTTEDLVLQAQEVQTEIERLQLIVPANYEEYNDLRLKYDMANVRMMAIHTQRDAMELIKQLQMPSEMPTE